MQEEKFVKIFRTIKIVQLCLLLGIELVFFITLIFNKELSSHIYSDRSIFMLCTTTWILMIFNLLCLFMDFYKLRSFAAESHALKKAAYLDNLTGIPNRHSLDVLFQTYDTPESLASTGCAMFTISNLKEINDQKGHSAGDSLIQQFCTILEEVGDPLGFMGRNGGNEFVAVINNCDEQTMNQFMVSLQNRISLHNEDNPGAPIIFSSAYTLNKEEKTKAITQLLAITYNKLYHVA